MEPIINPWLIYLADKAEYFGRIFGSLCFIFLAVYAGVVALYFVDYKGKDFLKKTIYIPILLIVFLVFFLAFPDKDTIYSMLAAKQLTPNNIEKIETTAQENIDYILEKIKEINTGD